jgi:single-stranded DNA-binding protein
MIRALIGGSIFRGPETKVSRSGSEYLTCLLKVADGNEAQFVRVFVFSESAREEFTDLHEGDGVSVSGALKAEAYDKDGQLKVSFSVTADRALSLKKEKREKDRQRRAEAKAEREKPTPRPERRGDPAPFSDDVPF